MWQRFEILCSEGHILSHDVVKVQTRGFKHSTITWSRQDGQIQLGKCARLALDEQRVGGAAYRRHVP